MRIEKVRRSRRKKEIAAIYKDSFPKEERMPFPMMVMMSLFWNTQFLAFYDNEKLCGLVYMAVLGKQTFIMFFAVDAKLRSNGYGGSILKEIQAMYPENQVIVSIEPCFKDTDNIEQRLKRKNFYIRKCFQETDYWMKLAGQTQEILIKNGTFHKWRFRIALALYSCGAAIPKIWKQET